MAEKRAVQVSHELWRQIMTQGHTSAGFECIQGIPEDATLVRTFSKGEWPCPDLVFVFESDLWEEPSSTWIVEYEGQAFLTVDVVFQTAECRTCKWWQADALARCGECRLTREDDFVAVHEETVARAATGCNDPHPVAWLNTQAGFGCTQYELREANA